jgi:hypothetical protein
MTIEQVVQERIVLATKIDNIVMYLSNYYQLTPDFQKALHIKPSTVSNDFDSAVKKLVDMGIKIEDIVWDSIKGHIVWQEPIDIIRNGWPVTPPDGTECSL